MGNVYTPLRRLIVLGLVATLALGSFSTVSFAKAKDASPISVPVVGTVSGVVSGSFSGIANITSFAVNSTGQLVATGTITGVVTDTAGTVVRSIGSTFSAPVQTGGAATAAAIAAVSCDILSLTLGPIHLDLLGLVIDTNQINLNITAVPGAGNLLGNLLCAVTNLLNGGLNLSILQQIAGLLNQILAAL